MTIISGLLKNLRKRRNLIDVSELFKETTIPLYKNYLPMLNKEFSRIRRFEHSMTIATLKLNGFVPEHMWKSNQKDHLKLVKSVQDYDVKSIPNAEFIYCGLVIKISIRDIDTIVYDPVNYQFIIIFPEINIVQAQSCIDRIKEIIGNRLADHLIFGLAEFPQNGLILDDLIKYAVNS